MSDVQKIQAELDQANQNIKGLVAQLDAAKQMCNEGFASCLQLRTNVNILQQAHREVCIENGDLKNQIDTHKAQVVSLTQKILELQPPVMNEQVEQVS